MAKRARPDDVGGMSSSLRRTMFWITAYAIAMGILEAAVVIYLRRLYFPEGFRFPMRMIETEVAIIELWREAATIFMLSAVGVLAGRTRAERFAWFIYCFGVWDLAYYAGLKGFIGWPESFLTWDILFLIPVPWVGPVIAPCIVAVTMCVLAFTAVRYADRGVDASMTSRERWLLWTGAFVIIVSFTIDWARADGPKLWNNIIHDRDLLHGLDNYIPRYFPWSILALGEALGLASWLSYTRRLNPRTSSDPQPQSAQS